MTLPVVAIVGRPNVGKSTLFNRMVGFRKAVVHDRPGVTRDRLYEEGELISRRALIIDTGGIEPEPDTDLLQAMRLQSLVAVEEADVIVLVVDAQAGWTPADADVVDLLRSHSRKLILAVNKVDGARHDELIADFYTVGVHEIFAISAEHGRGMYELLEAIEQALPEVVLEPDDGEESDDGIIRISVIGRPNIGKSTLINKLLGEERHLVMDEPGTTMDPVDSRLVVGEQTYVFVDTAGVRKRAKIDDKLERFVSLRSIRSIERCHISLLLVDATEGLTDQDARLAQLTIERGRALILLINKWDLTTDLEEMNSAEIDAQMARKMPHTSWAPYLFISAKTGKGLHRILPMVDKVYKEFDRRVSSSKLNQFLETVLLAHTPPQQHNRPVRIYYMTQARVRPPTFVAFSNSPEGVGTGYRRYLVNALRERFGFEGAPVKLHIREKRKIGEER